MKQLTRLHENFIEMSKRPMSFGNVPVNAKKAEAPLIAVNKWKEFVDGDVKRIEKSYKFMTIVQRNQFVAELLEQESVVGHKARITIDNDTVVISLSTQNIGLVTEIDKEVARFCDLMFKDIVYSPQYL